ncbi:hypothetical protein B6C80_17355 [Salmonella enterica subsp. enterica serovar Typhimurium]
MKTFSLVALILLLCSCSAPHHDSTQAVKQFYTSWMTTFTNDVNTPDDTTALMQRYVAKEVIHRLALIQSLYEQEIVGADYFMYAQDYAPEGNDSNLLIVFYVQIMPDDFVMQLHRF